MCSILQIILSMTELTPEQVAHIRTPGNFIAKYESEVYDGGDNVYKFYTHPPVTIVTLNYYKCPYEDSPCRPPKTPSDVSGAQTIILCGIPVFVCGHEFLRPVRNRDRGLPGA